ncbi:oxidoreductase-like protein [Naematelia encephala]|uniref:Oxidoreductase-like protein n=1 Tax=Naematelia encephala TaxID=71784 RepID=A0A1Y2AD46_9TREE|nr:oxidoreductase-like protein [Naematelia encephala]
MILARHALLRYTTCSRRSLRAIHTRTTATRKHDVLAPFRRPSLVSAAKSSFPTSLGEIRSADRIGVYETSSTSPAGTSFQDVPPPPTAPSSKLAVPLPAMKPLGDDLGLSAGKTMMVQGISVPPKPRPPGEEECCMSGCVHCVYTIYADELEEYNAALEFAREALLAAGIRRADWPEAVKKMDNNGGVVHRAEEEVMEGMDANMAAFLALENKLKKKQAPESSAASA